MKHSARSRQLAVAVAVTGALTACGGSGSGGGDTSGDVAKAALGGACRTSADCLAGVCLESEYGTPFCTRACDSAWDPCPAGEDAAEGEALCVSFEDLPNPAVGPFIGDLTQFCLPRCVDFRECTGLNSGWEACDVPKYLGDPLFPGLGNVRVCGSPSFQGKEPVDPALCDWDKTVAGRFANEANLCRSYCAYLDRCKELPAGADTDCCAWGCYNRVVIEDEVQDGWHDAIKCYIETSAAYPDSGPVNACTEPPKECGGPPEDPTPPAARPSGN